MVDAKVALTFLQFLPPIGGAYSPTLRLWPGLVTRFDPQTVAGVMSSTTRTPLLEVLQLPLTGSGKGEAQVSQLEDEPPTGHFLMITTATSLLTATRRVRPSSTTQPSADLPADSGHRVSRAETKRSSTNQKFCPADPESGAQQLVAQLSH